jgi:threonine synthase
MSNAMDVGDPSNFSRLLEMHGGSAERVRRVLSAASISEEETRAAIRRVWERDRYVLDPHGAVGWAAADRYVTEDVKPIITLATAHAAKFDDAIRGILGFAPPLPESYADWAARPLSAIDLDRAEYDALRRLLVSSC